MSRICFILTVATAISCTQKPTETSENQREQDSLELANTITSPEETDDDCVFNNDLKGVTADWLNELKIDFTWNDDLAQAVIPKGEDTVFVSVGGCTHFYTSVEMKLTGDQHEMSDSTFFIQRALALATEFKLDNYKNMIEAGRIKRSDGEESTVWFGIDDDDADDNLYYDGIEVRPEAKGKRILISQYFN